MEIELITNDIKDYLNKYTRFMSKRVYITKKSYDNFTSFYDYIYENAENSIINYKNILEYQKILEIKDKGYLLVKRHNQKYLEELYKNSDFVFDKDLSKRDKLLILSDDDFSVLYIKNSNEKINIIKNKISYINTKLDIPFNMVCLITNNDYVRSSFNNCNINIYSEKELDSFIDSSCKIIGNSDKYDIFSNYIKNILFKDKKKFKEFYLIFQDKLYLNEDVLDFETFNDYHNYMSKRKYISSKLDKASYVKELIRLKTNNLLGIDYNKYDKKVLVDIANTLYCSSIEYNYIVNDDYRYFEIYNEDVCDKIFYFDKKVKPIYDDAINLYSSYSDGTSTIEHLVYELVKRRYPIVKKSYEELYEILNDSNIDNYFRRFIDYLLIPFIDMVFELDFDINDLENIYKNLDGEVKKKFEILISFYKYYVDYIESNNFMSSDVFRKKLGNIFLEHNYKYLIFDVGDNIYKYDISKLQSKFKIFILRDDNKYLYQYLMPSIKLYSDFKEYVNKNKIIPIQNVYASLSEYDDLALDFTIKNIDSVCNNYGNTITYKKSVEVYIYDDSVRLKQDMIRNKLLYNILSNLGNDKLMVMGRDNRDIDSVLNYSKFSFDLEDNVLLCHNRLIDYLSMNDNNTIVYDIGVLINPMDCAYGFKYDFNDEDVILALLSNKKQYLYNWERKLFYNAISRVKTKLVVLCPKSRALEFIKNIANHNEVKVKKEVFSAKDL